MIPIYGLRWHATTIIEILPFHRTRMLLATMCSAALVPSSFFNRLSQAAHPPLAMTPPIPLRPVCDYPEIFQRSPEGPIATKLNPVFCMEYRKSYDIPYSKTNHYSFLSLDELFHFIFNIRRAVICIRSFIVKFISFLYLA